VRSIFDEFDTDHSGSIDKGEVQVKMVLTRGRCSSEGWGTVRLLGCRRECTVVYQLARCWHAWPCVHVES
jgi:hypothetical protein